MSRHALLAVTLAVATASPRLVAQTHARQTARWTVHGSLGLRYGTALVRDSIVTALEVTQHLGPTLGGGVTSPVQNGWSGEAAVDLTLTGLTREEAGARVDLGGLRTFSVTAAVRREIAPTLSARVGAGALFYFPATRTGLFRSGSDAVTPLGIVGVGYAPAWGARYGFALDVRYDIHRFFTPALRAAGFADGRFVHRVAVGIRAGFGGER